MNRDDAHHRRIVSTQVFLLVLRIPILLRRCDVIERFGGLRLIRAGRVHGRERSRARVRRRFGDRGPHVGGNRDDFLVPDELNDALDGFLRIRDQTRFGRMIARQRPHHFFRLSGWIDLPRRLDERVVVFFQIRLADGQNPVERRIDHLFVLKLL